MSVPSLLGKLEPYMCISPSPIISNEGKRIPEYQEITQLGSERTIERYIQQLRESNLIEFKGESPQTGGYYLTELLKEKLK